MIDWRKRALALYEAWTRGEDVLPHIHEIGAALKEEPDCPARNATRPDAACALPKGHAGNHRWPRIDACPHPFVRVSVGFWCCTTCGAWRGKADGPPDAPSVQRSITR